MKDKSSQYRAGFLDGFDDLPPTWLGVEWYKLGYAGGSGARQHPDGLELLGESLDGDERVYLVGDSEVYVRFDRGHLEWSASVPGYGGGGEIHVSSALGWISRDVSARAGRWLSEGRALYGFGRAVRFFAGSVAA